MENNALATNPKANISTRSASSCTQMTGQEDNTGSLMSMHIPPEALGMSLGDFWAFVTRDYVEALAAMPTMTPIMIHKGVPDFLRPVVWGGLARARDAHLYHQFDVLTARLEYEQPSNENIIEKDLGRCFPTHDLFVHPDGEGQRMLGQVLKCYNLHDPEIGYCQGMGFIVGILLMKMDVRDAFCVFVRYVHVTCIPLSTARTDISPDSWKTTDCDPRILNPYRVSIHESFNFNKCYRHYHPIYSHISTISASNLHIYLSGL